MIAPEEPAPSLAATGGEGPGVDAEALVAALWESPGVGVAVWTPQGRFVAVNEHLAAANGMPAADHPGRLLEEVLVGPAAPAMRALLEQVLTSGRPRLGVEFVQAERVWETAWLPMRRGGEVLGVACVGFDVARERRPALAGEVPGARSAAWTSRLLAVTQALNAASGPAAALSDAFGQVAEAMSAQSAMVAVLEGGALRFRPDLFTTRAVDAGLSATYALDDPTSFSVVAVLRNEPVWVEDERALRERYPLAHRAVQAQAARGVTEQAWAAVPIRNGGQVLGVLRLSWATPQTFTPEQRAFLQATADHAGHVLLRVGSLERERSLRAATEAAGERNNQLLGLARGLAVARSSVQVARVLAEAGYGGVGAVGGGVGLVDEAGRRMRILDVFGGPSWVELPLDSPLPFVRAAVTGEIGMQGRDQVAAVDARALAWMERVGSRLALSVPLHDDDRVVGSLSVHLPDPEIDQDRLQHVQAVAALVGQALGRTAAQEQAQNAVAELQRALLPRRLPVVPGVEVHAGYRASVRASEIGGDFYDVVARPDGGAVLLLGDVQGHDLTASAIMAQLRAVLHTLASDGEPPAELLARADRFLAAIEPDRLATVVVVDLDPATGLAAIAVAGHLPPVVAGPSGAEVIEIDPGLPLGLLDTARAEHVVALPPRARLVLLTDGLIERRDEAVTDSLEALAAVVAAHPGPDADTLVAELLERAPEDTGDDAAVLVADVTRAQERPALLTRTLPPGLRTPPTARHWARVGLARLGLGDDELTEALTVLTELVTNAARAASDTVSVTLDARGGTLLIGVRDDSDRRPRRRSAADDDTEGRGLLIVEALARRWWVEEHETGKTVWAQM